MTKRRATPAPAGAILGALDEGLREADAEQAASQQPKGEQAASAAPIGGESTGPVQSASNGFRQITHIVRTIGRTGGAWHNSVVSAAAADEGIAHLLREGWEPIHVRPLGYEPEGVNILWVMGYTGNRAMSAECKHFVRTISPLGVEGQSISGFQADQFISSFLDEGWRIAAVSDLGIKAEGLAMFWMLVR